MIETMPDGRAVALVDCPDLKLAKGKIYGNRGNALYWLKKRGLVHHEHRGARY